MLETARVLESDKNCPELPLVEGGGQARAVAWPGVGSRLRSMTLYRLDPASRTVAQTHEMEAVYYIVAGDGEVIEAGHAGGQQLVPGSMAHVEPGTTYQFVAGGAGMELVGGPCPPDPALYRSLTTNSTQK